MPSSSSPLGNTDPTNNNAGQPVSSIGQPVFTVTELNRKVRQLLEGKFPLIVVQGEISNLSSPASGHLYFSLKDEQSQVRCAMFRNRAQMLAFKPKNGDKVQLHARVSLYEGRGDYQLIAETMEEQGRGALIRAFEALKHRLKEEGLFDRSAKKPLPPIPDVIGLVTSPTGAAVRDMLTVLNRRFPLAEVIIYPAVVQGVDAPDAIARAIELAHLHDKADLLIVGRGGGSLEDLWAFNDERVARAIFASLIPIVSAVGHETDITISDYVADLRAPTPSAAAELVSPDLNQWQNWLAQSENKLQQQMQRLLQDQQQRLDYLDHRYQRCYQDLLQQDRQLQQMEKRLTQAMENLLLKKQQQLDLQANQLRHPKEIIQRQQDQLVSQGKRLTLGWQHQQQQMQQALEQLEHRLKQASPEKLQQQSQQDLSALEQRLYKSVQNQLAKQNQTLAQLSHRLETVSPLATLSRGYAIVEDDQGNIIRHHQQVEEGDTVTARLSEGQLICQVQHKAT